MAGPVLAHDGKDPGTQEERVGRPVKNLEFCNSASTPAHPAALGQWDLSCSVKLGTQRRLLTTRWSCCSGLGEGMCLSHRHSSHFQQGGVTEACGTS